MGKEVVNNTKFNKPNAKVNNLKNKIPYPTILIHINPYNTDKKKIGEKNWRCLLKKIPDVNGLLRTSSINTNNGEFENKISDMISLVTNNVLNINLIFLISQKILI